MDDAVYYLYENLRSLCPIPEDPGEERLLAFALGLDFGLSLGRDLDPFRRPGEE